MRLPRRLPLLTGGLLLGPVATAAPAVPTTAPAATRARAAAPVNFSCALPKNTSAKNCRSFSVPRGRTVSVELVSSGGKALTVGLKNSSGNLASKRVSPGSGYAVHWTNNASGARSVTLYISEARLVEVKANLRYRIG
ncbi:hypothetical protein [Streptomyces sp. NPDC058374]|uniref:hypothetical protein n=1 Tax=Streptomyces sp. NPDC058374 TaxID=3346466 RepID=UPI00364873E7